MLAMISKEFRQVRRDKRTLAMMIAMPVVLLVVFGYAASFDVVSLDVAVAGPRAAEVGALFAAPFEVVSTDPAGGRTEAEILLRDGKADVALVAGIDRITALIDGSELFNARAAKQLLTAAQSRIPGMGIEGMPELDIEVLYNPDLDTSSVLVPGLAGLILLFVGTLLTSLGIVRERQAGTLEQLVVMPFKARDVIVGKIAPYFLVASIDMIVVLVVGNLLFDVPFRGSLWILALGAILFLLVTLGIGVLISTVSENQGQAIQLGLMTLMPQVMLSGIIFPLDSMAAGVRWIGYLLPLSYFNIIAKGVMLKGAPLSGLIWPFAMLATLGTVVFAMAIFRFSRDLAPARAAKVGSSR